MGGLTLGYVLRRVGMFFLTIWLGSTIIFIIPRLAPGDPVSAMIGRMMGQGAQVERAAEIIAAWRARFGLDEPLIIQYFKFMGNVLRFDGPDWKFAAVSSRYRPGTPAPGAHDLGRSARVARAGVPGRLPQLHACRYGCGFTAGGRTRTR